MNLKIEGHTTESGYLNDHARTWMQERKRHRYYARELIENLRTNYDSLAVKPEVMLITSVHVIPYIRSGEAVYDEQGKKLMAYTCLIDRDIHYFRGYFETDYQQHHELEDREIVDLNPIQQAVLYSAFTEMGPGITFYYHGLPANSALNNGRTQENFIQPGDVSIRLYKGGTDPLMAGNNILDTVIIPHLAPDWESAYLLGHLWSFGKQGQNAPEQIIFTATR